MSRGCAGSGREAITAEPRSRAAAQKQRGRRRFRTDVPYPELHPGDPGASSSVLKHLPPSGPAASPDPRFSFPPPRAHDSLNNRRGGEEDGGSGGLRGNIKHDRGGFVLTEGGAGAGCCGWGGLRCGEEMGGGSKGSFVLMSRRRSSGPPWSALRPPGPGHPWS